MRLTRRPSFLRVPFRGTDLESRRMPAELSSRSRASALLAGSAAAISDLRAGTVV